MTKHLSAYFSALVYSVALLLFGLPLSAAHAAPPPRAYELVSPVGNASYPVSSNLFGSEVITPASGISTADGYRIAFAVGLNGTLPGMALDGNAPDFFVGTRRTNGWDWSVPLGAVTVCNQTASGKFLSLSADGSQMLRTLSGSCPEEKEVLSPRSGDGVLLDQEGTGLRNGAFYRAGVEGGQWDYLTGSADASGPTSRTDAQANTYVGGSPDLSTVYFSTAAQLVPQAVGSNQSLYRRSSGATSLMSQKPDGSTGAVASTSAPKWDDRPGAVSSDGESITFDGDRGTAGQLVLGDTNTVFDVYQRRDGQTIWASPSRFTGTAETPANRVFEGASADGTKVFFSTSEKMIGNGATAGDRDSATDIYRYDTTTDSLALVSVADQTCSAAVPNPCDDNASNTGATNTSTAKFSTLSPDGSHVFFVTGDVLSPDDVDGVQSLYVRELSVGRTRYIAPAGSGATTALNGADVGTSTATSLVGNAGAAYFEQRPIKVSDDGTVAAFALKTDVDLPAGRGGADADGQYDIFVWTEGDGLRRVRQGAAPDANTTTVPALGCITPPMIANSAARTGVCPAMSSDGKMIFVQTADTLSPQDTDAGFADVYAVDSTDGSVSLVSAAGDAPFASTYYDNSATGDDVFFLTQEALDPSRDTDGGWTDLYDARVGKVFPPLPAPPTPCDPLGATCEGPVAAPPTISAPVSSLFVGPGNVNPLTLPSTKRSVKPKVSGPKTVRGTSTVLRVKVSGKGKIRTSGSGLKRSYTTTKAAKTYKVKVRLSRRSQHRINHGHRVRVRVTVRFTPTKGKAQSVRVSVTFRAKKNKRTSSTHSRQRAVRTNHGASR